MASPLSWLATAGVKKNANGDALSGGKVYAYTPGTTTQAPIYGDADQASIQSQPLTLDAQGRTVDSSGAPTPPYFEDIVDLYFYDNAGTFLFKLTRANAEHATEVELENAYFNGTLSDGSTGASGRTTLNVALTSVGSSAGGMDGKFKDPSGGTERALNVVISEQGLSVKSKGALGNDSAIDTQAFKDAIATLKTAGGGRLIVPPGTYRIDDTLLVDFAGLTIVGAGLGVSTLKMTVTGSDFIRLAAANNFAIGHLSLTNTGTSTEAAVRIDTSTAGVIIDRVGIAGYEDGIHVLLGSSVYISRCPITLPNASGIGVIVSGASNFIRIDDCLFVASTVGTGLQLNGSASNIKMRGCQFTGVPTGLSCPTAGDTVTDVEISGNEMNACSTAAWNIAITAAVLFNAVNNRVGSSPTVEAFSVDLASAATVTLDSRFFYHVSGAAVINHIRINHLYRRQPVVLKFAAGATVTHNAGAPPANHAAVLLAGAANFVATADDTLTLVYDGATYREIARTVI